MSLKTRSSFLYGFQITSSNYYLDFKEGETSFSATLLPGNYTIVGLAKEVQRAMGEHGLGNYSCVADRVNRKLIISCPNLTFSILTNGNHAGVSAHAVLGFNSDKLEVNSCTSDLAIGTLYVPQYPLQEFVDPENCVSALSESVNESATHVEIVSIGEKRQCEFNIKYITNFVSGGAIENNQNAVSEARAFLNYLRTKGPFDFYPNREDQAKLYTMILEKNEFSANGTGFKLYEMRGSAGVDYYETKNMTFRVVNL